MARWLILVASLAFGSACAPRPWVTAARSGTLAELQRYVEVAADRSQFNHSNTFDLAEVVAEREIETGDDAGIYDRIAGLGPCVSELYTVLERRSKRNDEGAVAASIVLFEAGFTAGLRVVSPQKENGIWRAYAVSLATNPAQRHFVYSALIDPDVRVRQAAMRVITQNPMLVDSRELLDVAHWDPDPSLKQAALAALGEIGDVTTLLIARDYWGEMVESTHLALVQAFASPRALGRGGEQLLVRIMESNDSLEGVVAASLLFNDVTASRGYAMARLLGALRDGSTSERLVALATLPPNDPEVRLDVQKLATSSQPYLRTAALELYLKRNFSAESVRERLRTIAASKDADADEAARVLALDGDLTAISRVERQLRAASTNERLAAARLLLKLKRWPAVARSLTDDHPAARLAMACDVLAQ